MDQLNNSVIREPAGGDVNTRETLRGAWGGGYGGARAWQVTSLSDGLSRSLSGAADGRGDASPIITRKYDKKRQNFRPSVSLTFQGVEIGRRPLGVMCDVLAG
ncbi:unnamed protein product [Arctia plantaginis]|uniref:Uncharacterized protein n=1 Tax=Arctia plantaginis TaxID=874455 RepID=A0A8S0Z2K1_ARCPL|nr:unnamed protein product [Arctia plantaginis]CAB3248498.1 unnamed protein product [Arctia plantaginis]